MRPHHSWRESFGWRLIPIWIITEADSSVTTVLLPEDFYVDIVSDQSAATPTEMRVAGCLNSALDEVSIYLMKKGERREMINSYDAEAAREIIKRKTKKPHTDERGLTLINFPRTLRAWQKSLLQNQPLLPLG